MKKILIAIALLILGQTAIAQDDMYVTGQEKKAPVKEEGIAMDSIPLTDTGSYERQEVINVEDASAAMLFERAMVALSDWTGPDGKSKIGVDYQNQETHTVIYKGSYSLGFKDVFMGNGWKRQANFTLKVRCKDGRARVTIVVPTITGTYNNHTQRNWTVKDLCDAVQKAKGDKRKRGEVLVAYLLTFADNIMKAMSLRLQDTSDDDF